MPAIAQCFRLVTTEVLARVLRAKRQRPGPACPGFLLPLPGSAPGKCQLLARRYGAGEISLLAIEVRLKCLRSIRRQPGSAGRDEHRVSATVGAS